MTTDQHQPLTAEETKLPAPDMIYRATRPSMPDVDYYTAATVRHLIAERVAVKDASRVPDEAYCLETMGADELRAFDYACAINAATVAEKDAEIAALRARIERLSLRQFAAIDEVPLARECADYATSLRSVLNVQRLEGKTPARSFLRAADLFERASIALTELPTEALRERAERAEADAGRLEWLDAHPDKVLWSQIGAEWRYRDADTMRQETPSLRYAIDGARAASQADGAGQKGEAT